MDYLPSELLREIFKYFPSGNLLNISFVCKLWYKIINKEFPWYEIVLVVDVTGSVPYWRDIQDFINNEINSYLSIYRLKFGMVCYTDHDSFNTIVIPVLRSISLSKNVDRIIEFVNKIKPRGGDDRAEAVMDGLFEASRDENKWTSESIKNIILCLDAPPHGKQYGISEDERYPDGCPCGLTESVVITDIFNKNIGFNILHMSDQGPSLLLIMIEIFRTYHPRLKDYPFKKGGTIEVLKSAMDDILKI